MSIAPRTLRFVLTRTALIAGLSATSGLLSACASLGLSSGAPAVVSTLSANRLSLDLPTRVFTTSADTVGGVFDMYLTDLPSDIIASGDLTNAQGVLVHVNLFVLPRAGDTPISVDATTSSVRIFVLSGRGQAGLYAGGGFLTGPDADDLDDPTLSGRLRDGTLHLVRATPGFDDLLGPSTIAGPLRATRDADLSARLSALTVVLGESLPALE